jgi:hypothetical protein
MLKINFTVIYMEDLQKNRYRYERKYLIRNVDLPSFLYEIYKNHFFEVFEERRINNLYYDDLDFNSLMDNIDGLSERKKFRIRWYGNTFENSNKQFEVKSKSEFLNTKKVFKIGKYKIKDFNDFNSSFENLCSYLRINDQNLLFHFENKSLKIFNTYLRKYFLSRDREIRITIDNYLEFYSPLTKNVFKEPYIIVEVKYNNHINFLNNYNQLTLSKYSKYVKGIISTSFHNPLY